MTRTANILIQVLALMVNALQYATNIAPERAKPWIALGIFMVQGIVAIVAQSYNPDGTPASEKYDPNAAKPGKFGDFIKPIVLAFLCSSMLMISSGFTSCGRPAVVNTNPTRYDTPTEALNGIVSSTNASATIYRNHHNAKRSDLLTQAAAVKADKSLTSDARKAQLTTIQAQLNAETDKFEKFNNAYKDALRYEREAGNVIKTVAASGGSTQTATDKIKLASDVVVNELLAQINDQSTRDSLLALNNLMQKLIGRLGGQ